MKPFGSKSTVLLAEIDNFRVPNRRFGGDQIVDLLQSNRQFAPVKLSIYFLKVANGVENSCRFRFSLLKIYRNSYCEKSGQFNTFGRFLTNTTFRLKAFLDLTDKQVDKSSLSNAFKWNYFVNSIK